jgi:hypothetical protein
MIIPRAKEFPTNIPLVRQISKAVGRMLKINAFRVKFIPLVPLSMA